MKIITCRKAIKKIFELLEGKISQIEKGQLDKHLEICKECCNRLEFEKLFKDKLHSLNNKNKTPHSLEKKINDLLRAF